jgi:hypothetical protein
VLAETVGTVGEQPDQGKRDEPNKQHEAAAEMGHAHEGHPAIKVVKTATAHHRGTETLKFCDPSWKRIRHQEASTDPQAKQDYQYNYDPKDPFPKGFHSFLLCFNTMITYKYEESMQKHGKFDENSQVEKAGKTQPMETR